MTSTDTICAIATAQGGAIGVIRISGPEAISITAQHFRPIGGAPLTERKPRTAVFGHLIAGDGSMLDEVLVTLFRAPHSYTGEDSVEISCHGSSYILQQALRLLIDSGCRLAAPGEYTQRAFLNGKMDLSQAEAVADLIASTSAATHRLALSQLRGGFSKELATLRDKLLHLTSLMELELDFSDHEELEFADRSELTQIANDIEKTVSRLANSFSVGNAIKNGVPVAIIGETNAGKSTLLNALLNEEKAIVSDIHGTTRDVIEDTMNLGGITFRFIDTAGIRETKETIEIIGIERTYQKLKSAQVVILVLDASRPENFKHSLVNLTDKISSRQQLVIVLNKMDETSEIGVEAQIDKIKDLCVEHSLSPIAVVPISAKKGENIDDLQDVLVSSQSSWKNSTSAGGTLVSNIRHYQALMDAQIALDRVEDGLASGLPTDLVAQDIREALYHLGSIVGEINTEEILGNIFGRFCIGK